MNARWIPALALLLAAGSARAERLVEVRQVAAGDYLAPKISPTGDRILVTGAKFRGLRLLRLDGRVAAELSDDAGAGLHARFVDGDHVLFRAVRAGERREVLAEGDGTLRAATETEATDPVAVESGDRIYVKSASGSLRSVASGDRFFGPRTSPDGARVAFQGIATGVYVYERASGELLYLGRGTEPAWSPSGDRLVFERTEDDGHVILESELFLFDLATHRLAQLTHTPNVVERRPSFGPDGETIAYDDDRGAIFVGRIAEGD